MKKLILVAMALTVVAGCKFRSAKPDGSGTIEATQVHVSALVGGRIESLPFDEGAAVKRGDIVANIDLTDYQLKWNEAKAALELAETQLALIVAGAREEDIKMGAAKVAEAQATYDQANADFKRMEGLYKSGTGTKKQLDDATAGKERADALLQAASENLKKLQKGNRDEDINLAKAQVELSKAKFAQADKALKDCKIVSPIDGVVSTKSREIGETIVPGAPILTVTRRDEVWLPIYIAVDRLAAVKIGAPARVKVDGVDKYFDGTISFVASEAEFTPRNIQTRDERAKLVYRVKITLKNPDGMFKPGMPADGYLGTGK